LVKSVIYQCNQLRYQQKHHTKLAAQQKDNNAPVKKPKNGASLSENDQVSLQRRKMGGPKAVIKQD
jgi:hypothetical protein